MLAALGVIARCYEAAGPVGVGQESGACSCLAGEHMVSAQDDSCFVGGIMVVVVVVLLLLLLAC